MCHFLYNHLNKSQRECHLQVHFSQCSDEGEHNSPLSPSKEKHIFSRHRGLKHAVCETWPKDEWRSVTLTRRPWLEWFDGLSCWRTEFTAAFLVMYTALYSPDQRAQKLWRQHYQTNTQSEVVPLCSARCLQLKSGSYLKPRFPAASLYVVAKASSHPREVLPLPVFAKQGHFYSAFIMQMYSRNALGWVISAILLRPLPHNGARQSF